MKKTPSKAILTSSQSVNNQVVSGLLDIFETLKNKPENIWKNQFDLLKEFLSLYSVEGNHGLLKELNKKATINFDMVQDDGFDVVQIIWEDKDISGTAVHNILNGSSMWQIWKDIEKTIIKETIKKIKAKLSADLGEKFDEEIKNPSSLNALKTQIWNFFDYVEIADEVKDEIKKIKITNKDVVDSLVIAGKLNEKDIAWDYANRNISYRRSFDKMITQQYLGGMKESIDRSEKDIDMIKDTFSSFVPNMSWLFEKYPYNKKEIENKYSGLEKRLNLAKKIKTLEKRVVHGENVKDQFDEACFEAYVWVVQDKDQKLWDILSKLFQNKFDFSKLDKNEQKELLDQTLSWRIEELKKRGTVEMLEINQNNFDKFVKDVFDLEKSELVIPSANWDIKLEINKSFKWWENLDLADINNFSENKIPLNFEIKILWENKDLINDTALKKVFAKEISEDWKFINLDWDSVGKLLLMYTLAQRSFDKIDMNAEKIDKLKNTFDVLDKKIQLQNNEMSDSEWNNLISDNSKEDNEILGRQRHFAAKEEEIRKNGSLVDDQRISKSREKINLEGKEYNDPEEVWQTNDAKGKAILDSHYCTVYQNLDQVPAELKDKVMKIKGKYYEMWKDWERVAWLRNYTNEQIKKKVEILKKAWFNSRHIKILLQDWFCGIDADKLTAEGKAWDIIEIVDKWETSRKQKAKAAASNYYIWLKKEDLRNFFTDELVSQASAVVPTLAADKTDFITQLVDKLKQHNQEEKDRKAEDELEENRKEEERREEREQQKEEDESEHSQFMHARESLKWYNFPGDTSKWFKEWTRIWIKFSDTELPPLDVWWWQWVQLQIVNITDKDFKVKLTWWELSAWWLEWQERTYPKNMESLELISNAFNGDVYKLPEAKEYKESLSCLKAAWLSDVEWLDVFDELELKWWKLQSSIIDWNPEITHFGSMETKVDTKTSLDSKQIINYEVSFNSNWTVDVKYNNYNRNMDYNNFLIFVSTKRLKPKTKEDVEIENKEIEKWPTHTWSRWKFFGVANIWHMVQWMGKKVNEWIKKFNEKQDKKFNNIAMWQWRIANKLKSVIWWIPGVWDALENMDTEYQNSMDWETWAKTEEFLKRIEWHNDFWAIFDDPNYMNDTLWKWVSLRQMVINGQLPWWLSGDKRFVASALLLAQINKWPWPYEKIEAHRFKWIWVKLILGEPYYSKFMADQKEIIAEVKAKQWLYGPWYDAQLANELARAEMTFLVNNIWGRNPWQRLWNMEGADYGRAKTLWSDKFANELDGKFNEYVSKTKIDEWVGKLENVSSFSLAYIEFRRNLIAWKPTKSLPYLKRMAQLAKSPDQIKRLKAAISYGMLTWFFLHHTLPWTQARLQTICRSFGFSPWLRATHLEQQKKLAHFFNVASGWTFYKSTWYKLSDFSYEGKLEYKPFIEKFEERRDWKRWQDGGSKQVDKFLNEWIYNQDMKDPIVGQLKEASMESQEEEIDNDVSKNSRLISNYPLALTKWVIRQISNYENWAFTWNIDEVQRSQDAWNAIAGAIPSTKLDRGRFVYITKRFLNRFDAKWFDYTGKEEFLKRLATVKKYRWLTKSTWEHEQFIHDENWTRMEIGKIRGHDVKNLMRYIVNWEIFSNGRSAPPQEYKKAIDAFRNMFWDNMDMIDDNFITQTFGKEYVGLFSDKRAYKLAPWNHYWSLTRRGSNDITDKNEKQLRVDYKSSWEWWFINGKLEDMEKDLRRRGTSPWLWSFTDDEDDVYTWII